MFSDKPEPGLGAGGGGWGPGVGGGELTSRHRAPALLEMYTFVLLAKFFPTEPKTQEESLLFISRRGQILTLPNQKF